MPHHGQILIVEDDDAFLRAAIVPVFARRFSMVCAHNVQLAHDALDHLRHLVLAIIDLNLPGGEEFSMAQGIGGGFEIAHRVREDFPFVTCAILTAHTTPPVINAAQLCAAELIAKEECHANLMALRGRLERRPPSAFDAWGQRIVAFADEHGLSARQRDVLSLAAHGHSYRDIADRLDLSIHTVKSHVHTILEKSRYRSLKDIVADWSQG